MIKPGVIRSLLRVRLLRVRLLGLLLIILLLLLQMLLLLHLLLHLWRTVHLRVIHLLRAPATLHNCHWLRIASLLRMVRRALCRGNHLWLARYTARLSKAIRRLNKHSQITLALRIRKRSALP